MLNTRILLAILVLTFSTNSFAVLYKQVFLRSDIIWHGKTTSQGSSIDFNGTYLHDTGFYVGTWFGSYNALITTGAAFPSSIKENDIYLGWMKHFGDWSINLRSYTYTYAQMSNWNTHEASIFLGWKGFLLQRSEYNRYFISDSPASYTRLSYDYRLNDKEKIFAAYAQTINNDREKDMFETGYNDYGIGYEKIIDAHWIVTVQYTDTVNRKAKDYAGSQTGEELVDEQFSVFVTLNL